MKKHSPVLVVLATVVLAVALIRVSMASPSHTAADAGAPVQPGHAVAGAAPAAPGAPANVEDSKAVYRVPLEDSPVRGPADALVTIVESTDFECPFCRQAAPTMKEIEKAYGGKVRFAFKHNPLSMHAHALKAALIAEEARARGGDARFWEVHDRLFDLASLDGDALEKLMRETGIDERSLQAGRLGSIDRMRRDQNLLNSLGARGTPTFFINGRKVGGLTFDQFRAVIDEELAKAKALVDSGVAPRDVYVRTVEKGAAAPVLVAAAAAATRTEVVVPLRPDDPARGGADARVTVVEFSDFQCPFCSRALPAVQEVEQSFGKEVRVVWKHLPLPFHPNAMPAALAAEAARQQGKFWEMHDRLFASQGALSDATYQRFAKELNLDLGRFDEALHAPEVKKRVEADIAAATAAGVTGTPTFVVNGEVVLGSGGLKDAVQRQLKKAQVAKR